MNEAPYLQQQLNATYAAVNHIRTARATIEAMNLQGPETRRALDHLALSECLIARDGFELAAIVRSVEEAGRDALGIRPLVMPSPGPSAPAASAGPRAESPLSFGTLPPMRLDALDVDLLHFEGVAEVTPEPLTRAGQRRREGSAE